MELFKLRVFFLAPTVASLSTTSVYSLTSSTTAPVTSGENKETPALFMYPLSNLTSKSTAYKFVTVQEYIKIE